MPEVTRTYDGVLRNGAISLNKSGDELQLSCYYLFTDNGDTVRAFGSGECNRDIEWAYVPQNVKDALVTIDAYMQVAMNEDAGLV